MYNDHEEGGREFSRNFGLYNFSTWCCPHKNIMWKKYWLYFDKDAEERGSILFRSFWRKLYNEYGSTWKTHIPLIHVFPGEISFRTANVCRPDTTRLGPPVVTLPKRLEVLRNDTPCLETLVYQSVTASLCLARRRDVQIWKRRTVSLVVPSTYMMRHYNCRNWSVSGKKNDLAFFKERGDVFLKINLFFFNFHVFLKSKVLK